MTKRDSDMDEELREHVARLTEQNLAAGMNDTEARRAALLRFGSAEVAKETARSQRRLAWLADIARDLGFGARLLRRSPGFAAVVVLTLGLGIGACAAIFSVVNHVLLRPPPFPQAERVVVLREVLLARGQAVLMTSGKYLDWQRQATSFDSLGAMASATYNATGFGQPVVLYGSRISANLLPTLRVQPLLGRNFRPEEQVANNQENVAILSHKLWRQRFGGRADVLTQALQLNGRRYTIVGVMPGDSGFAEHTDVFTPLAHSLVDPNNYGNPFLQVFGRLRPGVTLAQAQGELTVLAERTARAHPISQGWGVKVAAVAEESVAEVRPALLSLLAAVGFLLLIACANVASLQLARAPARAREMAVRAAMGASRGRVIRQLLSESVLLSALGGALGLLVARGGLAALSVLPPDTLPRASAIAIDGGALAFILALVVLTGVGFGLAPAFYATRVRLTEALQQAGRGNSEGRQRQRLRGALVVAEVAIALVLLAGAGLLMRSFSRLAGVDPGFNPEGVSITTVFLPRAQFDGGRDGEQFAAFAARVVERIAAVPGVAAAAVATNIPLSGQGEMRSFTLAGRPLPEGTQPVANRHRVGPGYFQAMGTPLLRGRAFDTHDTQPGQQVVIINQSMARRFFPGGDALGQRLDFGGGRERVIVGIAGDVRADSLGGAPTPQIYEPFAQDPGRAFTLVVRSSPGALAQAAPTAMRAAITALDPDQPTDGLRPLAHLVGDSIARQRFTMKLFAVFAASALLLAALGIYGVMAYTVNQRTGEIGVRLALGARTRDILRLVLAQGGRLVGLGVLAGVAGALGLTRFLQSMLFEVGARDPLTFAAIVGLLAAVAGLACLLPAWRAARVDPMNALRGE